MSDLDRVQVGKIGTFDNVKASTVDVFLKLQVLNDELRKKKEEFLVAKEELTKAELEIRQQELALYHTISQERKAGFKELKYEKEAERKAAVQLQMLQSSVCRQAQDKFYKLEAKVKLYDIAIDWLEIEIHIWQSFADFLVKKS